MKHADGIAGAVTQRQDHVAAADRFAAGEHHAFEAAVFEQQIGHSAFESHFATESDDFLAHRRDDPGETKGTDVRFVHVHDFFRSTGADKLLYHLAAVE